MDCLCLPIGKTQVTTWVKLPISTNWKDTSYDLILVIVDLYNELIQISQYTQTAENNFRYCNIMS